MATYPVNHAAGGSAIAHDHSHEYRAAGKRGLLLVLGLICFQIAIKTTGGVLSGSLGLLAHATHVLRTPWPSAWPCCAAEDIATQVSHPQPTRRGNATATLRTASALSTSALSIRINCYGPDDRDVRRFSLFIGGVLWTPACLRAYPRSAGCPEYSQWWADFDLGVGYEREVDLL